MSTQTTARVVLDVVITPNQGVTLSADDLLWDLLDDLLPRAGTSRYFGVGLATITIGETEVTS